MEIVISHLRNSIAVVLTVFLLAVVVGGPMCARTCAIAATHACCEDGAAQCPAEHSVSTDGGCGHAVVLAAERVEQPVAAAGVVFATAPVRFELGGRAVRGVGSPARFAASSPPGWFDPLLVSFRV
jgi:hypothetical protein